MATTHWIPLTVLDLAPGASVEWWWNNANYQCVYAVNVSPLPHESGTLKAEITKFWRTFNSNPGEPEVHWIVKNTGSVKCFCYQFMSAICP